MSSHSEDENSSEMYSSDSHSETETETETDKSSIETESESGNESYETESVSDDGKDDESIDSEEQQANEKARAGGVSEDPFQRRIPQSFYDNEQKKFKPLEKPWEKAQSGDRAYFVNHKTKTTSWVDPRTEKTRTHDIMKCKMGELPYGWEEAMDKEIGVYYIDHNTQSTYLDPPWDPRIQFQVSQLRRFLDEQIKHYKKKLEEIKTEKEIEKKEQKTKIDKIKKEKEKLEKEIKKLRDQMPSETESEYESEYELPPQTVEEFQKRLKGLMELQEKLIPRGGSVDELKDFKETQEEIVKVQQLLEDEAKNREKILEDIEKLRGEITETFAEIDSNSSPEPEKKEKPKQYDEDNRPKLTRKTRYEMELELIALKKRLEAEKQTKQRLQTIQTKITDKEGALPTWVKKIEEVASSKTLRVKISQKQASGPDALSFRERMLFFAAKGAEANAPSKIPPPPGKRS